MRRARTRLARALRLLPFQSCSRLFHADQPNPTPDTLAELLRALQLRAEVTLRRAPTGEPPIRIKETA